MIARAADHSYLRHRGDVEAADCDITRDLAECAGNAGNAGDRGNVRQKARSSGTLGGDRSATRSRAGTGNSGYAGVDFAMVNAIARRELPFLLARWLPDGRVIGREYVARNPRRNDRNLGSFKVNLRSGKWADFATGDSGGDPVSLVAYLFALSQGEAARRLADQLGVRP